MSDNSTEPADPGGPLVAYCGGYRCSALWRSPQPDPAQRGAQESGLESLSSHIAESKGAILMRTECLGLCEHGAVVGIAYRDGADNTCRHQRLVSCAQRPTLLRNLLGWIAAMAERSSFLPPPDELRTAMIRVTHR